MTRHEFLLWAAGHTPWTPLPIPRIPEEWWGEVELLWARHLDFLDNMLRSINKMGGHIWVSAAGLQEYARGLSVEEQVGLFLAIRSRNPCLESQYRPEFEAGFPEAVAALPPPFTTTELEQHQEQVRKDSRPMEIPF
jgi:hypothetical protein